MNAWIIVGMTGQGLWLMYLLSSNGFDSSFSKLFTMAFILSLVGVALIWKGRKKEGAYLAGICNLVGLVPLGWVVMIGANKVIKGLKKELKTTS